jgi:putative transposase
MDRPIRLADAAAMKHCALRTGRHSREGQAYLVTFTTLRRRPVFQSHTAAMAACAAIADLRLWRNADLLAWVLMPDHWHGLTVVRDETLSRLVQRLKANVSRRVNVACDERGRVWAPAFHDRALREEEDIVATARYIVANPIRAGLARRVGDYPYWNAIWLSPSQERPESPLSPLVGAT